MAGSINTEFVLDSAPLRTGRASAKRGAGRSPRANPRQPIGSIVDDAQLEKLTVNELRDLKDQIDLAIRAVIRASRAPKPLEPVKAVEAAKFDLERERDAWLLAKK